MEELAYQIKNGNGKIGEQGKILLKAELYPCYLDLKLEKICEVEKVEVSVLDGKFLLYSSVDGVDYHYFQKGEKVGYLRIFLLYQKGNGDAEIQNVRVFGHKTQENVKEVVYQPIHELQGCEYDREFTEEDTIQAVYEIIERVIGKQYVSWFLLELKENKGDYFRLQMDGEQVKITSNTGVGLAVGINW